MSDYFQEKLDGPKKFLERGEPFWNGNFWLKQLSKGFLWIKL